MKNTTNIKIAKKYEDNLDTIREMLNEFNQQLAEQPLKGGK